MLIYHLHLVFLILKQQLLSLYCFSRKQAGLLVIISKDFSDYTLFCAIAELIFQPFIYLSASINHFAECNELFHDFSTKFSFHYVCNFLFSLLVVSCHHPLDIRLYQFLSLHLLQCLCKNFMTLSHIQSCPYSIILPYSHT